MRKDAKSTRGAAVIDRLEPRTLLSVTPVVLGTVDGAAPRVAVDAAGDVFGTTLSSGDSAGTVYEIPAGTNTVRTLVSFGSSDSSVNTLGINPGDILIDAHGDLFGDANSGGALTNVDGYASNGTLWELPAGGSAVRVLYTFPPLGIFPASSGYGPTSLSMDSAGDLFGSAEEVIPHPYGTAPYAFEYVSASGTTGSIYLPDTEYASLYPNMASSPAGDGYVLEVSPFVGSVGVSLIRVPASTTALPPVTLATFATPTGVPAGSVVPVGVAVDSAGDAFVTATDGTITEVAAGISTPTVRATLPSSAGSKFTGNPVVDAAGDLFTVTSAGGANGFGSLVELKAGGSGLEVLMPFTTAGEAARVAEMTVDAAGNLFATRPTATGAEVFELLGVGSAAPLASPPASPLNPSVARSTVPAAVLVGAKVRGAVTVTLDNSGSATVRGTDQVDLYAVAEGQVNRLVGSARRVGKLAGHGSAEVTVPVKPVALAAGSYTLIAVVTDAAGDKSTAATGPTVTVSPITVTLSARVSKVSTKFVASTSEQVISFTLTVTNTGDGPTTGPATVALTLTTADRGLIIQSDNVPIVPASPVIRAGRSRTVRATFQGDFGIPADPATLAVSYVQGIAYELGTATAVADPVQVTVV
jgi:hypothetical protein